MSVLLIAAAIVGGIIQRGHSDPREGVILLCVCGDRLQSIAFTCVCFLAIGERGLSVSSLALFAMALLYLGTCAVVVSPRIPRKPIVLDGQKELSLSRNRS